MYKGSASDDWYSKVTRAEDLVEELLGLLIDLGYAAEADSLVVVLMVIQSDIQAALRSEVDRLLRPAEE